VTRRFAKMARVFVGTSRMRQMAPRPRRIRPRAPSEMRLGGLLVDAPGAVMPHHAERRPSS